MSVVRGFFANITKATVWRSTSENFYGDTTYTRVSVIDCTYTSNTVLQSDASGREFMPAFAVYTKSAIVREGDYLLIGESNDTNPPPEANEVRRVSTASAMYGTPDYDIFVG
jgi:hypothetical protein